MNAIVREVPSLADEVDGIEFGDKRLTKRLVRIVEALGARPHDSIPAATATRAEMEATYRFFANEKVTPETILSKHFECSLRRCAEQPVALLIQDTTEVDLTRLTEQVAGAGPLDNDHRFGAFVHPLLAMDVGGVPMGFVLAAIWTRTPEQEKLTQRENERKRKHTLIEDKESMRWLNGIRQARRVAEECPDTTCVCIADSEADIFELFAEPRDTTHGRPLELLIRAAQERVDADSGETVLATVRKSPVLYECVVDLSPRRPKTAAETRRRKTTRVAREATVQVRATTVTVRAPWRADCKLTDQTLNVVLVEEVNTPDGEEPLQWILLTTLPIGTSEEVRQVVAWYCQRWGIEVYFRTLKSGCRIEERQFEYLDRELNFIAVSLIHAWRVLLLCRLGHECPDMSCDVVFDASEWKAVYMHRHHQSPPEVAPTLNEMIRWIAALGGHVIRSKNRPGTQTLWLGLQRVNDLAFAWNLYGPATATDIPNFLKQRKRCVVR